MDAVKEELAYKSWVYINVKGDWEWGLGGWRRVGLHSERQPAPAIIGWEVKTTLPVRLQFCMQPPVSIMATHFKLEPLSPSIYPSLSLSLTLSPSLTQSSPKEIIMIVITLSGSTGSPLGDVRAFLMGPGIHTQLCIRLEGGH